MSASELASARFSWEEGLGRLERRGPLSGARLKLVEAVHDELRRRVGVTFTLEDLARAYGDAGEWFLQLAPRVAPKHPEEWDPATVLDGAFALYARRAGDARPRR